MLVKAAGYNGTILSGVVGGKELTIQILQVVEGVGPDVWDILNFLTESHGLPCKCQKMFEVTEVKHKAEADQGGRLPPSIHIVFILTNTRRMIKSFHSYSPLQAILACSIR